MNFLDKTANYDIIWFGEIHGILENYHIYKTLIPELRKLGFKTILWEMPSYFSSESQDTEDGRINPFSRDFFRWVHLHIQTGDLENLILFGNKIPQSETGPIDYEKRMSEEMLDFFNNRTFKKTVIITGNYHMRRSKEKHGDSQKRCIEYFENISKLKILSINIKYSRGTFYNYGLKELPILSDLPDLKNNKVGAYEFALTEKDRNSFDLRIDEAHAVFK